ncbi:phenol 2-monooxygenase P2 subunit [Panacagrimonas perspica]|uniref:Phenol 2-monooxygenase P2 subunit n=1 Tax=Panacagrimonas perspica TaxID=381431 RepID=A0A4R7PFX5_9GAMM|nr:MmoB/DmpM family protein [Panacagrimonas perspica]TDU32599.1 phenol 2-monooxygenase P2 subunit [Panacagrimonas perspica]THD05493.1 monooxygenase [Panacagrimonas perspica]
MTDSVFIAFQTNDDTRAIVEAITHDNAAATVARFPAMVKVDAPGRLVVRRESIEERIGRDFDLRELHLNLISLSGNIEESEDEFVLHWGN